METRDVTRDGALSIQGEPAITKIPGRLTCYSHYDMNDSSFHLKHVIRRVIVGNTMQEERFRLLRLTSPNVPTSCEIHWWGKSWRACDGTWLDLG